MSSDDARADAPEEDDDAATGSPAEEPVARRGVFGRQPVFVVATIIAIVSLIAATTFGILWWTGSGSDEARNAQARDEVVAAAENGIRAFAEVDYQNPEAYRNQQIAVSTDELAQHVKAGWPQARQVIVQAQRSSTIKFFGIGVEELNSSAGTASAIASSEVTLSFQGQSAQLPRRWRAELKRVGDEWKLSDIELIPIPRTQLNTQG